MGLTCGMNQRETMLSPPGMVFDLFEIYLKRHGYKKEKEID